MLDNITEVNTNERTGSTLMEQDISELLKHRFGKDSYKTGREARQFSLATVNNFCS